MNSEYLELKRRREAASVEYRRLHLGEAAPYYREMRALDAQIKNLILAACREWWRDRLDVKITYYGSFVCVYDTYGSISGKSWMNKATVNLRGEVMKFRRTTNRDFTYELMEQFATFMKDNFGRS